jgi:hypothetical protein
MPTGQIIDDCSWMLAHFVPWFPNTAADPLPPPSPGD